MLVAALTAVVWVAAMHAGGTVTAGPADDWPMFQNNPQHSGTQQDLAVSASNAAHLTVRWKTLATVDKLFMSSPVVVFNTTLNEPLVYSTTSAGTVAARNLNTGAVVWARFGNGGIVATPAVFGNTVYVGTEARRLLAFDATTGTLQCEFSLRGAVQSSPVVGFVDNTGPIVFFGDTGTSEANNAGHEWAVNGVDNSSGACTRKWVFDNWNNKGRAANRTGSWSSPALTTDGTARPLLVFGSADPDSSVYALDARDGTVVWRFQTTTTGADQDVGAAPTISAPGVNRVRDGVVYVDGKNKIEYALDLLNGAKIWQFDLEKAAGGQNANAQSSTALIGDRLVVPYAHYLFKFDASTGRLIWRSKPAPSIFYASPAISGPSSDQVVLVGDADGFEHAYRLRDGTQLFEVKADGSIYASAAIAYGTVVFDANDGYLYALQ